MEIIRRNSDYALRSLIYLAREPAGTVVDLTTLATETGTPPLFLQKILQLLVREKVLISHRGAHGGVSLAQNPGQVDALHIIELMQGPLVLSICTNQDKACMRKQFCSLRKNFIRIQESYLESLRSLTLDTLAQEERAELQKIPGG
ncbi:MAG: Rrf2 family transcriptional regulator [Chitinivibrionales bacterium]|nr:Rrf2 family transcriptional regulator [Chitinivibrionales bacterium]